MHITDQIVALEIPFHIVPRPGVTIKRTVHLYLLLGEHTYVIDSGVAGAHLAIEAALRELGRDMDSIRAVLLTHAHPDHIGSLKVLQERSGCEVWAHACARPWIEDIDLQAGERPVPGFHDLVAGSVGVDRELADGEICELSGLGAVEVMHTPGHSPGSLSFWLPESGSLFTGDAMCVGAGFPVYEDLVTSWQSIQRLAQVGPVSHLLASWDKPRQAHEVSGVLDEARAFLQRVHDQVHVELKAGVDPQDSLGLTRRVLAGLGLPEIAANVLTAQAIASHVQNQSMDFTAF